MNREKVLEIMVTSIVEAWADEELTASEAMHALEGALSGLGYIPARIVQSGTLEKVAT